MPRKKGQTDKTPRKKRAKPLARTFEEISGVPEEHSATVEAVVGKKPFPGAPTVADPSPKPNPPSPPREVARAWQPGPLDQRHKDVLYRTKLEIEAKKQVYLDGLPHLYGWKWYSWAKAFFESQAKMNLLCAANQISKSSTQIRKCIHWATNKKLWQQLWPNRTPRIFWYLYPSKDVATVEFEKKWIPEFMPRGEFKDHPIYGWKEEYDKKAIVAIHFNSGITVYFKSYGQGSDLLQTATVDAIFCDEELPEELYDELQIRLAGTDGYFHMVFTATLNQDVWRRAMEGEGDNELFPDALKLQISMYDCMVYADGSQGPWTEERIRQVELKCKSPMEVKRRVYGKFVTELGRKYPTFDSGRHFVKVQEIPEHWRWYSGVDIGSGGDANHPAAIVFVAVAPDHSKGFVALGWRGDNEVTTSGDVLEKYQEMRGRRLVVSQRYDWHAKDFATIASRQGEAFEKADKTHATGEGTVNTLFRNDMLFIFDTPELRKLGSELSSVMKTTMKSNAKDDFSDALRYAVTTIPWDWSLISGEVEHDDGKEQVQKGRPLTAEEIEADEIRRRRGEEEYAPPGGWSDFEQDIAEANEAYGN